MQQSRQPALHLPQTYVVLHIPGSMVRGPHYLLVDGLRAMLTNDRKLTGAVSVLVAVSVSVYVCDLPR